MLLMHAWLNSTRLDVTVECDYSEKHRLHLGARSYAMWHHVSFQVCIFSLVWYSLITAAVAKMKVNVKRLRTIGASLMPQEV